MLGAVVNDFKVNVCMISCYSHGDKDKISTDAKARLEPITKFLGSKKFLIGDSLCYVDFVMLECLNVINWTSDGQVFKDYPTLEPYYQRLRAIPEIQNALAAAEKKLFNNVFAKLNHTVNKE